MGWRDLQLVQLLSEVDAGEEVADGEPVAIRNPSRQIRSTVYQLAYPLNVASIDCVYCGGKHERAADVRSCWVAAQTRPRSWLTGGQRTVAQRASADPEAPRIPLRDDPEPEWKGEAELKMPTGRRHPSPGAAAVQRRHPTPEPTGERAPLRDRNGQTTPPVTPELHARRRRRTEDYDA